MQTLPEIVLLQVRLELVEDGLAIRKIPGRHLEYVHHAHQRMKARTRLVEGLVVHVSGGNKLASFRVDLACHMMERRLEESGELHRKLVGWFVAASRFA